jgi:hypothetical protein
MDTSTYAQVLHNSRYPELLQEAARRRLGASVRPAAPSLPGRVLTAAMRLALRAGRRLRAETATASQSIAQRSQRVSVQ